MPSAPLPSPLRVVVTGAAGGIGSALAAKLADEGAEVVVSDLPGPGLEEVAVRTGGYAVPADMATADGVSALVTAAREHLGGIDAYFANAGIIGPLGIGDDDADWQRVIDVNVLAHVRAARLLLPEWLERRAGRFVVTASAAGLLNMIGAAGYGVTKHAAVAFAEWLSITHGDDGVVVQALCPQGVDTTMVHTSGPVVPLLRDGAVSPEYVADLVWDALQDNRFLILPHPEVADFYRARAQDTDRWLAGMRRLNAQVFPRHTASPTA